MRPLSYVNASLGSVTALRAVRWNDVVVERILDIACLVLTTIKPIEVGVVLGED
jgi:hypothetical protein